MDKNALIRARAYAIWEAEGCPEGRDEQHWHQAAQEIMEATAEVAEVAAPAADVPSKQRRKAPAAALPTPPALDSEPAGVAASPRRRKSAAGEPKPEPAKVAPAKPRARRSKT